MIEKAVKKFVKKDYDATTVIGEFSGRDSVAAIMKAFEDESINYVLPIATFAGTEYGDFNALYQNYEKLIKIVKKRYGNKKTVYPLMEYSNMDVWALMNGRQMQMNSNEFGFITPCIGCHLYFHLTKLPLALALSGKIISGERESHDGRIKINQLGQCLDSYQNVIKACGGDLIMPVRNLNNGEEVEKLIGWDWEEGKDHPKCLLSGNYGDANGKAVVNDSLDRFLKEKLEPLGIKIGKFLTKENYSFHELKKEVLL